MEGNNNKKAEINNTENRKAIEMEEQNFQQ